MTRGGGRDPTAVPAPPTAGLGGEGPKERGERRDCKGEETQGRREGAATTAAAVGARRVDGRMRRMMRARVKEGGGRGGGGHVAGGAARSVGGAPCPCVRVVWWVCSV